MCRNPDVLIAFGCRVDFKHRWLLLIKYRMVALVAVLVRHMNSEVITLHNIIIKPVRAQDYLRRSASVKDSVAGNVIMVNDTSEDNGVSLSMGSLQYFVDCQASFEH